MYTHNQLSSILTCWGLELHSICHAIEVQGSPERTKYRCVCEDSNYQLFVLEQVSGHLVDHKRKIAKTLEFLQASGQPQITPYLKNSLGEYISEVKGTYWQIVPFIEGVVLSRPEYVYDRWRGLALAKFLIDLHSHSKDIPYFDKADPFSLKVYIYELLKLIRAHHPELIERIHPILSFLEEDFMDIYDTLPISFCHGDYHPVNIIWKEQGMCYYVIRKNARKEIVRNPRYKNVPCISVLKVADNCNKFKISSKIPLYPDIVKNISRYKKMLIAV